MRRLWIVALVALSSCLEWTSPASDLVVSTAVSRSVFRAGDTITVTVTVANQGNQPRDLETNLCGAHPFVVTHTFGISEVGPDQHFGCLLMAWPRALAPGEKVSFLSRWAGGATRRDPDVSAFLPPGKYLLRGRVFPLLDRRPLTIEIIK